MHAQCTLYIVHTLNSLYVRLQGTEQIRMIYRHVTRCIIVYNTRTLTMSEVWCFMRYR